MALPFLAALAIWAAATIIQVALTPKPKRPRPPGLTLPRPEEGAVIPEIFGVAEVAGNIVWFGDARIEIDEFHTSGLLSTGIEQPIYRGRELAVLCMGPVQELLSIRFDDRDIRAVPLDSHADYVLSKPLPHVFGGVHLELHVWAGAAYGGRLPNEGGPNGLLHVHPGEAADVICELTRYAFGDNRASRWPEVCYAALGWTPPPPLEAAIGAGTDYESGVGTGVEWAPAPDLVASPASDDFTLQANPWGLGIGVTGHFWREWAVTGLVPGRTYQVRGTIQMGASGSGGIFGTTTKLGLKVAEAAADRLDFGLLDKTYTASALSDKVARSLSGTFVAPANGTVYLGVGCFTVEYGENAYETLFNDLALAVDVEGYDGPYPTTGLQGGAREGETWSEPPFAFQANNPTLKPITWVLVKWPGGVTNAPVLGRRANPADLLWTWCTADRRGAGIAAAALHAASFASAGATLAAERLGLSGQLDAEAEAADHVRQLLEHIDGVVYRDAMTGTWGLTLIRDDYVLASLPVFDGSNTTDVVVDETEGPELLNEVQVTFRELVGEDFGAVTQTIENAEPRFRVLPASPASTLRGPIYRLTSGFIQNLVATQGATTLVAGTDYVLDAKRGRIWFKEGGAFTPGVAVVLAYDGWPPFCGFRDAAVRAQNLAAITAAGGKINSVTIDLPWLCDREAAQQAAVRKLLGVSRHLPKIRFTTTRAAWDLHVGSVIRFQRPDLSARLADVALRVLELPTQGVVTDGAIEVVAIQDRFHRAPPILVPDNEDPADGEGASGAYPWGGGGGAAGQCARPAALVALDPSQITWAIQAVEAGVDYELETAQDAAFATDLATYDVAGVAAGAWATQVDPATPPEARYARVRAVDPTGIRAPSDWLVAGPYTSTAGTVPSPSVVLPTVVVTRSETSTTGTVLLTITDPQGRVLRVEFDSKAGTAPATGPVEDAAAPYQASVALTADAPSTIAWLVTYRDADGADATYEATETFDGLALAQGDPIWRRTQFI